MTSGSLSYGLCVVHETASMYHVKQEEIWKLKNQLATGAENQVHIHNHRIVIVINKTPLDIQGLSSPVLVWWYNSHNSGHKSKRRVSPSSDQVARKPSRR